MIPNLIRSLDFGTGSLGMPRLSAQTTLGWSPLLDFRSIYSSLVIIHSSHLGLSPAATSIPSSSSSSSGDWWGWRRHLVCPLEVGTFKTALPGALKVCSPLLALSLWWRYPENIYTLFSYGLQIFSNLILFLAFLNISTIQSFQNNSFCPWYSLQTSHQATCAHHTSNHSCIPNLPRHLWWRWVWTRTADLLSNFLLSTCIGHTPACTGQVWWELQLAHK